MPSILDHCGGVAESVFAAGSVLLLEGDNSRHLYILVDGSVEVLRGDTVVAVANEPGSLFGEMSTLLDVPHTATVRALTTVKAHRIENPCVFLRSRPEVALAVARMLAQRLNAATTYLVDLKRQYESHSSHLGMVGEVLETLLHHSGEEFTPGSDRQPDAPH